MFSQYSALHYWMDFVIDNAYPAGKAIIIFNFVFEGYLLYHVQAANVISSKVIGCFIKQNILISR